MILPLTVEYISEVARLHIRLDPTSLFAILGPGFREKIFYKEITRGKNCFGFVYLDKEKIVGYISCCVDSFRFFTDIKSKYRYPLLLVYLNYCVKAPIMALRYLKLSITLKAKYFDNSVKAEAVSFGVIPEYRTAEYYQKTGLNISHLLFVAAFKEYQRRGIHQVRFMVASDNVLANIFYKNLCLKVVGTTNFLGSKQIIYVADVIAILEKEERRKNVAV